MKHFCTSKVARGGIEDKSAQTYQECSYALGYRNTSLVEVNLPYRSWLAKTLAHHDCSRRAGQLAIAVDYSAGLDDFVSNGVALTW